MSYFKTGLLLTSAILCVTPAAYANTKTKLDTISVTATREGKPINKQTSSVAVIDKKELKRVSPSHPAEILNRTAGVYVNNLGGEGHMTAIRQPITTGAVYLFLEDGLPIRPTGAFNHNALYEIDIPQAGGIEITKGPGSALYGSDAIGGIINVLTPDTPDKPMLSINPEYGSYDWKRTLISAGAPINDQAGIRIDFNATDNNGFRENGDYTRYSTNIKLDGFINDETSFKTVMSYSTIDQNGVSGLSKSDYRNNTKRNLFQGNIGRREVEAFRLSTEVNYEPNQDQLISFTPYFRSNEMTLMPSWMLNFDAQDYINSFRSYGMLSRYRQNLDDLNTELITGLDVDYTPSRYLEKRLTLTRSGQTIFSARETGRVNYDFDTNQLTISPYAQAEWAATEKLRLTAGGRYDYFYIDYTDRLSSSVAQTQAGFGGFTHLRPPSQDVSFDSFNPKLGVTYDVHDALNLFANYRHSFRVPSSGNLFRSGSVKNAQDLKPVQSDSFEIGTRGQYWGWLNYETTLYHMITSDDIVSYIDPILNDRLTTNAGKTTHQGVEIGFNGDISDEWGFSTGLSYSRQKYDDFTAIVGSPARQINYAGNDIARAPRTLGNVAIQYRPHYLKNTEWETEWEHLGSYYTDETNTQKYGGHNLFNLRASYDMGDNLELYGRVMNVTDRLYSTFTSNQVGSADIEYRPGNPRTFYVGLRKGF